MPREGNVPPEGPGGDYTVPPMFPGRPQGRPETFVTDPLWSATVEERLRRLEDLTRGLEASEGNENKPPSNRGRRG